jgi:MYXO-CTERM domain-containing protein
MGIVNRRNAMIGWAVLKLGKRQARKKAKDVVPTEVPSRTLTTALAAAAAAAVGVLTFWRRRKGADAE